MKRLFRLLSAAMMTVTLLVVLGGAAVLYLVNNYGGGLPDHRALAELTGRRHAHRRAFMPAMAGCWRSMPGNIGVSAKRGHSPNG